MSTWETTSCNSWLGFSSTYRSRGDSPLRGASGNDFLVYAVDSLLIPYKEQMYQHEGGTEKRGHTHIDEDAERPRLNTRKTGIGKLREIFGELFSEVAPRKTRQRRLKKTQKTIFEARSTQEHECQNTGKVGREGDAGDANIYFLFLYI